MKTSSPIANSNASAEILTSSVASKESGLGSGLGGLNALFANLMESFSTEVEQLPASNFEGVTPAKPRRNADNNSNHSLHPVGVDALQRPGGAGEITFELTQLLEPSQRLPQDDLEKQGVSVHSSLLRTKETGFVDLAAEIPGAATRLTSQALLSGTRPTPSHEGALSALTLKPKQQPLEIGKGPAEILENHNSVHRMGRERPDFGQSFGRELESPLTTAGDRHQLASQSTEVSSDPGTGVGQSLPSISTTNSPAKANHAEEFVGAASISEVPQSLGTVPREPSSAELGLTADFESPSLAYQNPSGAMPVEIADDSLNHHPFDEAIILSRAKVARSQVRSGLRSAEPHTREGFNPPELKPASHLADAVQVTGFSASTSVSAAVNSRESVVTTSDQVSHKTSAFSLERSVQDSRTWLSAHSSEVELLPVTAAMTTEVAPMMLPDNQIGLTAASATRQNQQDVIASASHNTPTPAWSADFEFPLNELESPQPVSIESMAPETPAVLESVAAQIARQVEGKTEWLNLEIHPAELGQLEIRVAQIDDRLVAQIVAHNEQTGSWLERERQMLQEYLAEQGLTLDQVDIFHSESGSSDERSGAEWGSDSSNSGNPFASPHEHRDSDTQSGPASSGEKRQEADGINILV